MNNPTEEELRFLRKQSTKNHNLQCACNHLNYEKRQLTKRIAELEAQIQSIAEALEDFAKPPYKDSDLASLLEYHNKRALHLLKEVGYHTELLAKLHERRIQKESNK